MIATVVSTALAVILFLLSVVIHEAAHAYALNQLGYKIKAFGLGLPLWPRLKLEATKKRPYSISVSPWIIAAYVQARDEDEEEIKRLSYRDQAWFSGAGVVANLSVGGLLVGLVLLIQGSFIAAAVWTVAAVTIWLLRRAFCAVAVPAVALGVLILAAHSVVNTTLQLITNSGNPQMGGILGIGEFLTVSTPLDALKMAALMSLSLGLINMIPLRPFDGGRIFGELIKRWFGEKAESVFTAVTVVLAIGFFLYLQILDVAILTTR